MTSTGAPVFSSDQTSMDGEKEEDHVIISYCDDFAMWRYMESEVQSRLPFRNVQWRSTTGTVRTIDELNVNLQSMTEVKESENPLLNLYLVSCDDLDTYKTVVKPKIQNFVDGFEDGEEYMVVYVTTQDSTLAKNFKLRGSTFDKIKIDFGKNCTEIRMKVEDSSDVWDQFLNRLLEALITSFKRRVEAYEEKSVMNLAPADKGWDLHRYFAAKDNLAFEYCRMMLFEEALLLYDEVDTTMNELEVIADGFGACPWLPTNILEMADKPSASFDSPECRAAIANGTMSVFEFRSYLFARQCNALVCMSKPLAGSRRAYEYVSQRSKRIPEHQTPEMVEVQFVSLWSHSMARDLVLTYEQQMDRIEPELMDEDEIKQYLIIMADLRDFARKNLNQLGLYLGYLPNSHPFISGVYGTGGVEDPPTLTRRRRESLMNVISKEGADHLAEQAMEENQKGAELLTKVNITDLSLIDSLRYRSHFDDLYISLALSAIENYNFVKRNRRANLVHRDVAAMLFYRKNYGEAEKHLYIVCEQYVQDGWRSLELDIRSDLAHCQRRCGHYQKYIESCTTLITKACPLPHEEKVFYMEDITRLVHSAKPVEDTHAWIRRGSQRSIASNNDDEDYDEIIDCWFEPLLNPDPPVVPPRGVYRVGDELTISIRVVNKSDFDLAFDSVSLAIQIYGDDNAQNGEGARDGFTDLDVSKVPNMFKDSDNKPQSDDGEETAPSTTALSFIAAGVAVPVAEPDESGEIPPLFVTENDIVLSPGENTVQFALEAPIKGRYECIELIACMGNLQMRHIYDYLDIEYTISVDSSQINLSLAPDIPEKSIYLSGILQYIPLTINTHDGDMLDGTLTFMPSEGLLIEAVRDDRGLMYPASAPDEGIEFELVLEENWSIQLPQCSPGDKFTFEIAIIVPELCLIEHEVGFDLMYSKSTAEVFKLASVLALQFHNAFSVHTDSALTSDLVKYIKADIQSHLPIPIQLVNVELTTQLKNTKVTPSSANALVSATNLYAGQTADLLWDLESDDLAATGDVVPCTMKVEFELADDEYRVTAARTLQHVFEMNIDIYKPEYKSTILFKGMGEYDDVENEITIGESSEAEVLVTYLGDSDEERTVVANVEVNHRHWIVSGHDQRRLALSKNERQGRFGIVLIPLSVGQIFVPRVAMYESVTEGNSLVPCQGHDRDKGRQITVMHRSRNMPPQFAVVST